MTTLNTRLLGQAELSSKGIHYSPFHLRRMIAAGTFPKPVKLSERKTGYVEAEIEAWLKDRIADRDSGMEIAR